MKRILAVVGPSILCSGLAVFAQSSSGSSGMVRGSVLDPSGAAIASATVAIRNPVSGYTRTAMTDSQGKFQFENLQFNPYHVSVAAPKFQPVEQDVDVKSPLPVDIRFSMKIGTAATSVEVRADAKDLIEVDPVSHTDIDRGLIGSYNLTINGSSKTFKVTRIK